MKTEPRLTRLKTYPDLFDAASRAGCTRAYRLWLVLRFIDLDGSGRVAVADLQLLANAENMRGLSPSSISRLLRMGEGTFWTVYHDGEERYVKLRGLANVCVALDVDKLRADPVYIGLRYARSLKAFRAACLYARFAGGEPSNPISRKTIADLTGVSSSTQRAYARALGDRLDVRQNAATTRQPEEELSDDDDDQHDHEERADSVQNRVTRAGKWEPGDELPDEDDENPGSLFVDYVDGELRVLRRLPNSYQAGFLAAPRGMMRHVNQRLRGQASRTGGEADRSEKRLFYRSQKAAHRRMQRIVEGDWFYSLGGDIDGQKTVNVSRCGAVLWTQVRIANGAVYCG